MATLRRLCPARLVIVCLCGGHRAVIFTPWKINMEPENRWVVKENRLLSSTGEFSGSMRVCWGVIPTSARLGAKPSQP